MSQAAKDFAVMKALAKMGVIPLDEPIVTESKPRKAAPATRRRRQSTKSARKNNRPKRHR